MDEEGGYATHTTFGTNEHSVARLPAGQSESLQQMGDSRGLFLNFETFCQLEGVFLGMAHAGEVCQNKCRTT